MITKKTNRNNEITIDMSSKEIQYLMCKDNKLNKIITLIGPLTYIRNNNPYLFLIREIIEQMLSSASANLIYEKFVKLCNGSVIPENVNALSPNQIRQIGVSSSKTKCIKNITQQIIDNKLDLNKLKQLNDKDVVDQLTSLYGIGNWTAKMFLIFFLERENILPFEDSAFLQAYRIVYKTKDVSSASVIRKCKKWSPYSSIGARYLYKALDDGLLNRL